jgi:hypothetical protein
MARRKATKTVRQPILEVDTPYPYQTRLFIFVLIASVALRLWLLVTSRHFLRSDEAVTAMEVLDILDGEPIPFFHYGQSYGGGHTVEALMALPWFFNFGPADYLLKLGPAMVACAHVALVYLTLYRFFNKKFALIATTLFTFFATFLAANFYANGAMITLFFGWLGLHQFFYFYFTEKHKLLVLFLSGMAIGFAYYCFDYALYYVLSVITLWVLKENTKIWRQWTFLISFVFGFFTGAAPLLYYNLTHDFANVKSLLSLAAGPASLTVSGALAKFVALLFHDLPAFLSLDIDDFALEISALSILSYALFVLAVLYSLFKTAPAIRSLVTSMLARKKLVLPPNERIVYILLLLFLYAAIYSVSSAAGKAARYLIPLLPLIPILLAWPIYLIAKRSVIPAAVLGCGFLAIQVYLVVQLARDKTTVEWRIVSHGEDIKTLAQFLLDRNLTTVMTPYEIKWKLMFESQRKIVAASYMFGFDREHKYNMEVIDRVNRRGVPLAVIFDKEFKFHKIVANFNPDAVFDLDGFHEFLRQSEIVYRTTRVGDGYVVYHDFSKRFALPDPYQQSDTKTLH